MKLSKNYIIIGLLLLILIVIYYCYSNKKIVSRWGADGQYIKTGNTVYLENNMHKYLSTDKTKFLGIVVYNFGTKSRVDKIKKCEECILAYDGTPKIFTIEDESNTN